MKTNKMCPKYQELCGSSLQASRTDDELPCEEMSHLAQEDLIKVEGTKITLGKALLEAYAFSYSTFVWVLWLGWATLPAALLVEFIGIDSWVGDEKGTYV